MHHPSVGNAGDARAVAVLLRCGIALCFVGHGAFGVLAKEAWLPYFAFAGVGPEAAYLLMPLVGTVDIAVGLLALVLPFRALVVYAAAWCLWTAALRPLTGEGVWELLERAGNYGVPFALLIFAGSAPRRGWLAPLRTVHAGGRTRERTLAALRWTTALLLLGHGALALAGKPLLLDHGAAVGLDAAAVRLFGAFEVGAAALVLLRPSVPLLVGVALWKGATEALFLVAGEPVWEWIERAGSYVAPLAAALLLAGTRAAQAPLPVRARAGGPGVRAAVAMAVLLAAVGAAGEAAAQQTAPPRVDAEALERLRRGGLVLACRHAITDPDAPRAGDPFATRPITGEGERQAARLGELVRALGVPIGDVLTSPFHRTLRTAELAFGGAEISAALWTSDGQPREGLGPLLASPPSRGNRVLMTHQGILYGRLPVPRGSIAEGDCVVVEPLGASGFSILAQASNEDWERLLRRR